MKKLSDFKYIFKNKPRLSTVSDSLLYAFIFFCLFLTTIGRNLRPMPTRLFVAILISLPVLFAVYSYRQYKDMKSYYFKKDEKECEKNITSLCFMNDGDLFNYFEALLKKAQIVYTVSKNRLLINGKYMLHLHFTLDELEQTVVAKAFINTPKEYVCAVLGNAFSQKCKDLESRLRGRIVLIGAKEVYLLMKQNSFYPKSVLEEEKTGGKFIKNLKASFTKKRAKRFALTGCALLFMSLIVFYPVYYIVAGCLLILIAIFLLFFGKETPKTDSVNIFGNN